MPITPGRTYVIAEIGANHNGSVTEAKHLIDAAKECGCDCAKFQSWTSASIFSRQVYEENKFLGDDYRNRTDHTLESIVDAYSLNENQLRELHAYCGQVGIDFASTPFSKREVDFLCELGVPFIKVASMDLNNLPFLDYIASKGLPIILSTGMGTADEISTALRHVGPSAIVLHCVSVYPPDDAMVNLRNMDWLHDGFNAGFSDHTIGTLVPIAAIARGAAVLEKHFTLDKSAPGWDHKVSATPDEMRVICEAARRMPVILGTRRRTVSDAERVKATAFRRSIVAAKDIKAGTVITDAMLDCKRPGTGFPPRDITRLVGRTALRDIPYDKVIDHADA